MTLECDLDIESAHLLTKRNIKVKFNENRSKGADTKFKGKSHDLEVNQSS